MSSKVDIIYQKKDMSITLFNKEFSVEKKHRKAFLPIYIITL
jgi:hypothetical protein